MPRMTADLLVKCTGHTKKKRSETSEQLLRRITHLYCAEKGIESIEGLSNCYNLSVLYLYDNSISLIDNLAPCTSLTHLYLQNNHITSIENLGSLHRLTKLYLSGNAITVVEGLSGLTNLSELHIAHQRLPEGEKLLFDPRSLQVIVGSLKVLNVSGNALDTIEDLQCLNELTNFSATDNFLSNMKELSHVFGHWVKLEKLELSGNPVCQKHKYRDRVVTMGKSIRVLDGKEVSDTEKKFLLRWKAMRKARQKHQQQRSTGEQDMHPSKMVTTTSDVLSSNAAPPLTLPALPMRQLPRRSKRSHQSSITLQQHALPHHYQGLLPGQYFDTNAATLVSSTQVHGPDKSYDTELKLPDIVVPGRPGVVGSQGGGTLVDSISLVKLNQMLNLRALHAQGM